MQPIRRLDFIFIAFSLLAVFAGVWLYQPASLFFVNDDFIHIPLSEQGVLFQRKSFRPICDLSIAFDFFLWKKNPWGYHFTNLLLHVANSMLVYMLAKIVFKKYTAGANRWVSIFSGVVFFIYPYHSEAIFWILGRSASLGVLFFLPALIFYLRRHEHKGYFLSSLLCFVLALITYESVWVFPWVALLFGALDIKAGTSTIKKEIPFLAIVVAVFAAMMLVRYITIGQLAGSYEAAAFRNVEVKNLLLNMVRLLIRSFAPPLIDVSVFFGYTLAVVGLIGFAWFSLLSQPRNSWLALTLFGCMLGAFVPCLSLGVDTHGAEGERFLYLPSVFWVLLSVGFIFSLRIKGDIKISVIFAFIGYCILHLLIAQKQYRTASMVASATMKEAGKLKNKRRLFVDGLPEECNGAVIFRLGFREGLQWLKPAPELDSVVLMSPNTNLRPRQKYKVYYKDTSFLSRTNAAFNGFDIRTDAAFIFSDTALTVVK